MRTHVERILMTGNTDMLSNVRTLYFKIPPNISLPAKLDLCHSIQPSCSQGLFPDPRAREKSPGTRLALHFILCSVYKSLENEKKTSNQ